jgi:hypothetical protein
MSFGPKGRFETAVSARTNEPEQHSGDDGSRGLGAASGPHQRLLCYGLGPKESLAYADGNLCGERFAREYIEIDVARHVGEVGADI